MIACVCVARENIISKPVRRTVLETHIVRVDFHPCKFCLRVVIGAGLGSVGHAARGRAVSGDVGTAAQHASRIFVADEVVSRLDSAPPRPAPLLEGWVAVETDEGPYYWNERTGETCWERPSRTTPSSGLATVSL